MAVDQLRAAGYLDDAAYARRFSDDRRTLRRWGSERIARDLAGRGVAPEIIAAAVDEEDAGERELAAAHALLRERFPAATVVDDGVRGRAWRLLVRRGYAPELAYEAVRAHGRSRVPQPGDAPTA